MTCGCSFGAAGPASGTEHRLRRKDGGIVWCIISATPVHDSGGTFQGSFAMLTDITARKTAEEELAKKFGELGVANEEMAMTLEECCGLPKRPWSHGTANWRSSGRHSRHQENPAPCQPEAATRSRASPATMSSTSRRS